YWHPTGWVNQNWLTHVIFYWLTHLSPFADADTFSFNTLVYWKFAIYIITVICVYYTGRLLGVNPALSAAFACFAMFVGRSYFDIRPAGFSNLLVAVYLLILVLATYRNILFIWLLVPVVVFWCNVHGGYIYAFIMLVPFVVLNLLASFSRKNFVSIGLKGVYHTIAAGAAAFIAMIVFNPFHLTNLTHTFEISLSKHAERWRTVNEWHPGFEWGNPVGTGFPFLVLYMLCIGVTILWLYSRLLKPRLLRAPRDELEAQKRLFLTLSKILGWAAAIFLSWVVFISFSFLDLDGASFFICAVFTVILLLSVYKNVHFIYLEVPLILLALWAVQSRAGFAGRYFYPFLLLPAYVTVHIIASSFSKSVKIKPVNVAFVALTAVAALVLMSVIFNPLNLELPPWKAASEEAARSTVAGWLWAPFDWVGRLLRPFWHLRRIWVPRYEGNYKVDYTHLFAGLYIVNIASIVVWLTIPHLRRLLRRLPAETEDRSQADSYREPRIDLALMVIAALTVYMAVRSRRFIPIAAIAACPLLAAFIEQMVRRISAAWNFHREKRLTVSTMSYGLQALFALVGTVVVVGLGTGWVLKFKSVYLDPWPTDPKLSSVFMRMTASDAKPFYACRFIKDNRLKGKMFNYWTEGGFIAWGQQPDPNTGKTPLQLFMDGRAQAAYMIEAYDLWSDIMGGGRVAGQLIQSAKTRKRKLTPAEYEKIGTWVDEQLKKHDVWAILMPTGQFDTPFVRGLEQNRNWRLVFLNNKQKLLVDITDPQGRELFEGIPTGKTLYPDEFSKDLIIAHNLLLYGRDETAHRQGLDFAMKAFNLNPSHAPMQKIMYAARYYAELRPIVTRFCQDYLDRFAKEKGQWEKQDGYHHRIVAALNAASYLRQLAASRKDTARVQLYKAKIDEYTSEQRRIVGTKRW
ncbi:MAG: hypothetical protein ACYS76_13310, partial [Planctomycetota bacterium]